VSSPAGPGPRPRAGPSGSVHYPRALSAAGFAPHETGRLPREWAARYRSDAASPGVIYTATSYAAPIAWVRQAGQVVIPDEGYSATTSRHQNFCRAWLS